jgi:hypothetical protein
VPPRENSGIQSQEGGRVHASKRGRCTENGEGCGDRAAQLSSSSTSLGFSRRLGGCLPRTKSFPPPPIGALPLTVISSSRLDLRRGLIAGLGVPGSETGSGCPRSYLNSTASLGSMLSISAFARGCLAQIVRNSRQFRLPWCALALFVRIRGHPDHFCDFCLRRPRRIIVARFTSMPGPKQPVEYHRLRFAHPQDRLVQ